MEGFEKNRSRATLAKKIGEKIEAIAKLRTELELRKKTIGNSVDDQIALAETEYRLVKEEMTLLTLQEQHWESAAHWDLVSSTPDIQKELCEVLHSYIMSVQEKGAVAALHASEHIAPENSVLVSSQGDRPAIPRIEWAHQSTELQPGDRLLEVNGHLVIGKSSCEVSKILSSGRPTCRVVFLRPASPSQLLKTNGCKETSNLKHELTSVVSRLNRKMAENARIVEQSVKLQKDCDELKNHNRKLKLQVLSLQSVLLCFYQALEKQNNNQSLVLNSESPTIFEVVKKVSSEESDPLLFSNTILDLLSNNKKTIPWLDLDLSLDKIDTQGKVPSENVNHDTSDNR